MELTINNTYFNWDLDLLKDVFPTHKIHQLVKDFVHSIDPEIKVHMSGDEFYCIISEKIINVPFVSDPEGDRLFHDFVLDKFGKSINPYIMGILHECGHLMSYDKEIDEERSIIYYMLQLDFQKEKYEEFTYMYFSIPAEFEATKWAVNYYLSHKDICERFLSKIEV